MRLLALLTTSLLLLGGCTAPNVTKPGIKGTVVQIVDPDGTMGTGAVTGPDQITTAWHVADNDEGSNKLWTAFNHTAVIDKIIYVQGNLEPIVRLRLRSKRFKPDEIFDERPGGAPHTVFTLDGTHPFNQSQVVPGHSGSPVLDKDGKVVGYVYGRRCRKCEENLPGFVYDDQVTVWLKLPSE